MNPSALCTAFDEITRFAEGELSDVVITIKKAMGTHAYTSILIFDDRNGEVIDIDYRGSELEVLARLVAASDSTPQADTDTDPPKPNPGPGRPKLGVIGREVTLLPRHWQWLDQQSGGASVMLRKLVEQARKENEQQDRIRLAKEAANRFMTAMAGNQSGYEEATRALFAGDSKAFVNMIRSWPADLRDFVMKLAEMAFA